MGAYFSYDNENNNVNATNNEKLDQNEKVLRDFEKLEKYIDELLESDSDKTKDDESSNSSVDTDDISLPSIDYDYISERKKAIMENLRKKGIILDVPDQTKILNLFVRHRNSTIVFNDINPDKYVRNVKNMISHKLRIPINKFKLKYRSRCLEDYRTLRYYNVTNDATLQIIIP